MSGDNPQTCGHWIGPERRHCDGAEGVRRFLNGPRCPAHTPAALRGMPEAPSLVDPGVWSAALEHIAAGRQVFVLGRSKRPVANCGRCPKDDTSHDREACGCLTCHGFYAATRDPERVRAMLTAVHGGLLAIRTGAASGVVVVDIDPDHGGALDPAVMCPTHVVRTGSGGWHLYYRHPGGAVLSRPMPGRPGVDIKADGGYVVAPPSRHPRTGRRYRVVGDRPVVEMPPRLLEIVTAEPAPQPRPTGRVINLDGARSAGGISSPVALLAAHLRAVADAPVGRRRTTLYGAARGVARMVAAGAIGPADAVAALTDAGRAAQQTERDIRSAITGGFSDEGIAA